MTGTEIETGIYVLTEHDHGASNAGAYTTLELAQAAAQGIETDKALASDGEYEPVQLAWERESCPDGEGGTIIPRPDKWHAISLQVFERMSFGYSVERFTLDAPPREP